jgi:hypothetical protein
MEVSLVNDGAPSPRLLLLYTPHLYLSRPLLCPARPPLSPCNLRFGAMMDVSLVNDGAVSPSPLPFTPCPPENQLMKYIAENQRGVSETLWISTLAWANARTKLWTGSNS